MDYVIIVAGGKGLRMGSEIPKQFLPVAGKPILMRTIERFHEYDEHLNIILVLPESQQEYWHQLCEEHHFDIKHQIANGGDTRFQSSKNGLALIPDGEDGVVGIHDGVRPLISEEVLRNNVASVKAHGSAITTAKVKETIVVVSKDGAIDYVPNRNNSRIAKAPQSFWLSDILNAHKQALKEGKDDFIDSCTMMQHYGRHLFLVDGPYDNIKITTPDDFYTMRAILEAKENAQIYGYE